MNLISTDVTQKPDSQLVVPTQDDAEEQKSTQNIDAGHQEIVYCKGRTKDVIPDNPRKLKPIDLQKALDETLSMGIADATYKSQEPVWIVFYNQKNFDSLDILRIGDDLWNLDTPVYCDDSFCCFKHAAQSDTKRLVDIIKMFFEEDDWYGMVKFEFLSWLYEWELAYFKE